MGKVGGKQKRLVARLFDGKAEASVITVEADKNPAGFNVSFEIFAGRHVGLRTWQELAINIHLQMVRIGSI